MWLGLTGWGVLCDSIFCGLRYNSCGLGNLCVWFCWFRVLRFWLGWMIVGFFLCCWFDGYGLRSGCLKFGFPVVYDSEWGFVRVVWGLVVFWVGSAGFVLWCGVLYL